VLEVSRGYGANFDQASDDYLAAFKDFITFNLNRIPALLVVTQRPRELTRQDLRQLQLALDDAGFKNAAVMRAWSELKSLKGQSRRC